MHTTCTALPPSRRGLSAGLGPSAAHSLQPKAARNRRALECCGVPQEERHANATLSDALAAERERSSHAVAAAAGAAGAYSGCCGVLMSTASPHRNRIDFKWAWRAAACAKWD